VQKIVINIRFETLKVILRCIGNKQGESSKGKQYEEKKRRAKIFLTYRCINI